MHMQRFLFLLLAAVATGCGQPKQAAISTPDELVLYAIDGLVNGPDESASEITHFHGYEILGKVEITDAAAQQRIMQAVQDGIKESDGTVAACFWPRHGVRLVSNGEVVDYVICYECLQVRSFSKEGDTWHPTAATHQAVLTDLLTAAGIKLAPSIEEKLKSN